MALCYIFVGVPLLFRLFSWDPAILATSRHFYSSILLANISLKPANNPTLSVFYVNIDCTYQIWKLGSFLKV